VAPVAPPVAPPSAGAEPPPSVPQPRRGPADAVTVGDRMRRRLMTRLRSSFRLPDRRVPAPHPARMLGICAWVAVLGLVGLLVAGRSSVAIVTGAAPAWFEPTVLTVGVLGMALSGATFAAIHRRRLPWLLLAVATTLLAANLSLTLTL
jgi:hypothetical protein